MGMAASQARHISLVARKTNVEWEGQQINQARTALANETASLFNQMLGMKVPDCPDTTDFTKVQYSYSDGLNSSTIDSYYQISNPDPDYNYVVTHSYFTDVYTGSMKKLNDPQVQFKLDLEVIQPTIDEYQTKKEALDTARAELAEATKKYTTAGNVLQNAAITVTNTEGSHTGITTKTDYDAENNKYTVHTGAGNVTYVAVEDSDFDEIAKLIKGGSLEPTYSDVNDVEKLISNGLIYKKDDPSDKRYILKANLDASCEEVPEGNSIKYFTPDTASYDQVTAYNAAYTEYKAAQANVDAKAADYQTVAVALGSNLSYVGNSPLTMVSLDGDDAEAIRTELNQVVKDLKKDGINASILDSWDNTKVDAEGNIGTFTPGMAGTVFSFKLNNVTYFSTIDDLMESYLSGTGNNNIDGQKKLGYYGANYQSTKITKTEKALLETDGAGRFTSVKFEDDTVKYILNTETITDTEAYDNAMNQYYYQVQKYEKTIADINARTEIIQNEDRTLELRLKQLDTEESALTNEIDAVKKVLKDNVEKSFKTFSE